MKYIGKGAFTKCYLLDCGKKVMLKSIDPIKEVMSLGWFPDSPLFPSIHAIDEGVYESKYYPKVRSLKNTLKPRHYGYYKELRRIQEGIRYTTNKYDSYHIIYKAFEGIRYKKLREVMLEALEGCANIGSDIGFEISPRNVAVEKGNLVLIDCFFQKTKLAEVNSRR